MAAERESFQYALWRVVPSASRGERVNVGVVLYSRRRDFLDARIRVDRDALALLDPELDFAALESHLAGLLRVVRGESAGGPVAAMDQSDRFGFVTSPSDTIVQSSAVHTGLCDDPAETLDRLFAELVTRPG